LPPQQLTANVDLEENYQVYPDYVRRTCSTDLSIRANLKCVRGTVLKNVGFCSGVVPNNKTRFWRFVFRDKLLFENDGFSPD
jgi:hypothetical protein